MRMKGDEETCLDARMDDYISKPIQIRALRDVLARWSEPKPTRRQR